MNLSEMTLIVQIVLAPVVLLSAGSVMVNGVFGHYQAINDRLRIMCRERIDLCRTSSSSDELALARLELLDLQLPMLLRRHRMVRMVVIAAFTANRTFVICMIGIAVAVASDSMVARIGTLSLFRFGTALVLFGLATMVAEISGPDSAVRLEARRVLAIDYRPAPIPETGSFSVPRGEGSRKPEPAPRTHRLPQAHRRLQG